MRKDYYSKPALVLRLILRFGFRLDIVPEARGLTAAGVAAENKRLDKYSYY